MKIIDIDETQENLTDLVSEVEAGESIVIIRDGLAVAKMESFDPKIRKSKRRPGSLKGYVSVGDEFFDSLPEEDIPVRSDAR